MYKNIIIVILLFFLMSLIRYVKYSTEIVNNAYEAKIQAIYKQDRYTQEELTRRYTTGSYHPEKKIKKI